MSLQTCSSKLKTTPASSCFSLLKVPKMVQTRSSPVERQETWDAQWEHLGLGSHGRIMDPLAPRRRDFLRDSRSPR